MRFRHFRVFLSLAALAVASSPTPVAWASAGTLRIVSYNVDCFDQGSDNNIIASYAGLPTVLQGIGEHHIGTNAQPIDVLGVEELTTTTLTNLVNALNTIYGAGTYAFDPTTDPNTGGGPDGLIYNTHTVQVISAAAIGSASTSGAARAPMRYQIRPVGYGSDADFYMYVSHYKASSGTTNMNRRNVEATTIRQDADALGSSAHIIYSGDFNLTGGSSEPAWATLTAAGNGQAIDPTGATGWANSSSSWNYLYSESSTTLNARFDFQLVSNAMLNQPGLQLASDTSDPFTGGYPSSKYPYAYEVFGNNGTTALNGAVNAAGNTSLSDLANASTVLNDLKQFNSSSQFVGSDHLPVVADYVLVGLNPLAIIWTGGGGNDNWSTTANWASAPSNGSSLTFAGTTRLSNSNNTLTSAGSITFDNTAGAFTLSGNALSIAGGMINNSTSAQTIDLNLTLSAAQQLNAASGNLTVNGTVANGGNSLTVTGASNTTLAGIVSGSGGLVKAGVGTLTASGNNNYAGGTTVNDGTLVVGHVNALGSGGLAINSTATTQLQAGLSGPVQLPTLSIAGGSSPTATLDITDNNMIVHNGDLSALTAQAKAGLSGGFDWNGTGLTSTTARDDSNFATAVGVIQNDDGGGGAIYSSWPAGADSGGAVSVSQTDVLIKYTYYGDADLDGMVTSGQDYDLWLFGKSGGGTGWEFGDFDYDGSITGANDYDLWLYGKSVSAGNPLGGGGGVQPVPEPSTLLLAALGLAGVAAFARRRRAETAADLVCAAPRRPAAPAAAKPSRFPPAAG